METRADRRQPVNGVTRRDRDRLEERRRRVLVAHVVGRQPSVGVEVLGVQAGTPRSRRAPPADRRDRLPADEREERESGDDDRLKAGQPRSAQDAEADGPTRIARVGRLSRM